LKQQSVANQVIAAFQEALNNLLIEVPPSPIGVDGALKKLKTYLDETDDYEVEISVILIATKTINELKRFLDSNKNKYEEYNKDDRRANLIAFSSLMNSLAKKATNKADDMPDFFVLLNQLNDAIPEKTILIRRIIALGAGFGAVFSGGVLWNAKGD
jgi:hypothetical protein